MHLSRRHPSPDWSLPPPRIPDYLAEVRGLAARGGPEVIVGLEFDWFEGHGPAIKPTVEATVLDYRIGAVHHVGRQQFDVDAGFWTSKSTDERDRVFADYWKLIAEMAESSLFDIAAHLDLPKKLGFSPSSAVQPLIDAALDAIEAAGMIVELNTAGFGKPCADGYPSLDILRRCRQRNIAATLSSDGHIPEHILYEFERGVALLSAAGYTQIARMRARERWFEPLSAALDRVKA